jgi:predicted RNase H-like HicB family nuclease
MPRSVLICEVGRKVKAREEHCWGKPAVAPGVAWQMDLERIAGGVIIGAGVNLMKREFNVVYTPIEDGWVMAQVPELPGAVTQGRDIDEAREMIQEAVEVLLQSYQSNAAKNCSDGSDLGNAVG